MGKLNYSEHAKTINWKAFGTKVEEKLKALGKKYYIKNDLRKLMTEVI